MIKYVVLPHKRTVYAILEHTGHDAIRKINKMVSGSTAKICICDNKYLMPDSFKATVLCDPRDEWDVEEGKRRAKRKLLNNYHRSLNKRMAYFKDDVNDLHDRANKE